jgi:hypothetical protein
MKTTFQNPMSRYFDALREPSRITVQRQRLEEAAEMATQLGRDMFEFASNVEQMLAEFTGAVGFGFGGAEASAAGGVGSSAPVESAGGLDETKARALVEQLMRVLGELLRGVAGKDDKRGFQPEPLKGVRRGQPKPVERVRPGQSKPVQRFQPKPVEQAGPTHGAEETSSSKSSDAKSAGLSPVLLRVVMEIAELLLQILQALRKAEERGGKVGPGKGNEDEAHILPVPTDFSRLGPTELPSEKRTSTAPPIQGGRESTPLARHVHRGARPIEDTDVEHLNQLPRRGQAFAGAEAHVEAHRDLGGDDKATDVRAIPRPAVEATKNDPDTLDLLREAGPRPTVQSCHY